MTLPTPRLRQLARAIAPAAAAATLCFGAVSTLSSCSSTEERKPGDELGLTDKQKLGLFLENALRYEALGDINRTQDQARKGLEIDPGNSQFLLIFGRCALKRGTSQDLQVAVDTFQRVKEQDSYKLQMSWGAAVERLGVLYQEGADGVLDGSRKTSSDDPQARAAELHAQAVEYWKEAKERFRRSLDARSGEPEAINGLVRTTALLGEYEESIAYGREMIEAIKDSDKLNDRELYEEEGITASEESRRFRNKASNREFEVKTRLHIVAILRIQGRLSEAIEELDMVIALDPFLAQAHSQKAQLLFEAGDFVKARASVTRFLEMRAPTASLEDPDIKRAFELQERCDRQIVQPRRG